MCNFASLMGWLYIFLGDLQVQYVSENQYGEAWKIGKSAFRPHDTMFSNSC